MIITIKARNLLFNHISPKQEPMGILNMKVLFNWSKGEIVRNYTEKLRTVCEKFVSALGLVS